MSERKLLKCEKCGKPVAYVSVTAKSLLESKPDVDNVNVSATCMDCRGGTGFYQRNFLEQTNPIMP
jgi:hypothetical protein